MAEEWRCVLYFELTHICKLHNTKNIPQKQVLIQLSAYEREKLLNQTA